MEMKWMATESKLASTKMKMKAIWEVVNQTKDEPREQGRMGHEAQEKLDSIVNMIDDFYKKRGAGRANEQVPPVNLASDVLAGNKEGDNTNQRSNEASSDSVIRR